MSEAPVGDDGVMMIARACPACGKEFPPYGRRRWCSAACRQSAFRRRHQLPPPTRLVAKINVVYQCPECDTRYLGDQRCSDCGVFCRRLGAGGDCPHCGEPVAVSDLLPTEASRP